MNTIIVISLVAVATIAIHVAVHFALMRLVKVQPELDFESYGEIERALLKWRHEHFMGKRDGVFDGEYLGRDSQKDLAVTFFNLGSKDMCKRVLDYIDRNIDKDEIEDPFGAVRLRAARDSIRRIFELESKKVS